MTPAHTNDSPPAAPHHEALSEIAQLDHFYNSAVGRKVTYFLRQQIQPQLRLDSAIDRLGFGYPFMCLPQIIPPVLIPSEMGALAYGASHDVMTASVSSDAWPIASEAMSQIIIAHGLEYCFDGEGCLSEANRVLASAGEIIVMVPNRRSLWVRDDSTPLGHGRPFSKSQITKLLIKTGFEIQDVRRALFLPPSFVNLPFRLAQASDKLGQYGWALFGGMIVVRATKLRYAKRRAHAQGLIPALSPASKSAVKPALGRLGEP